MVEIAVKMVRLQEALGTKESRRLGAPAGPPQRCPLGAPEYEIDSVWEAPWALGLR